MLALILKHNTTQPGIVIVHDTLEPVLVGNTPLSKVLLRDYTKGIRFYVYDRSVHKRREKIVRPKNIETFISMGSVYYKVADMTIEQKPFTDSNMRTIEINNTVYDLEEIS